MLDVFELTDELFGDITTEFSVTIMVLLMALDKSDCLLSLSMMIDNK